MSRLRVPKRSFLVHHLREHSQYSQSEDWIQWYADVAVQKGLRTVKMLGEYKGSFAKVLDVGSGVGITLSFIAQAFPNSTGCDIDKEAIRATRRILKEVGVKAPVIVYEGRRLPFSDNSFDIVTSIEVIEHVEDPDRMLREIWRVLKPDGILHITTANKWWPYEPHFKLLFLSYLPARLADLYVKLSGRGDHYEKIRLPSYDQFKRSINRYFDIEDVTLSLIENYKKYSFDKERGNKVRMVGEFLTILNKLDPSPPGHFSKIVKWFLIRMSLGWLFICRPKK
ncbi:MAG: class I SAM-dependent methyltransferase [bacterium]|nr:class I SAM-dependent methyltransferase [bacterium]